MADATPAPVKSATRTLDIIEYVVARDRPVVAQEIAAALAIPVSSLSYLLNTLVERDYLARSGRRYTAGPGLARLQSRTHAFSLAERAAPLVRSLRVQLDETVSFFVRHGWEVEALVTETSEQALRYAVQIGTRTPLHGFSAGKAILAALPDEEVEAFLAETERAAFTPTTIVSAAALRKEIAAIRRDGIARTREEHTPGIQGIGRAAFLDGVLVGAFSIAIPTVRFDAAVEQRAVELLGKTCALLAG
ncbi:MULTISPECIES: IclR family transcriptional regulator [Sphingomonas]|uniref:IclR family transcriptional regulator n=1 Tax=Sphingomonas TaxID=13687 RepID=UPI000926FACB|nr:MULTISPECIES: IclR family transcriptional regulator [Sphingomonas]MCW6529210.1 IclR family transcriptional regulator [Sphingomonas lycopersici]OJU17912.1 MAG: IclR family transcriptional regulator [Sphingomonas sp. 66-10]